MSSRNMSASQISEILRNAIYEGGSYVIPHVVHKLVRTKGDLLFMISLFKAQDDFLNKSRGQFLDWFFATNQTLAGHVHCSVATIQRARARMAYLGLIQYRHGHFHNGKATQYRILIDPFYLADREVGIASNIANTKTLAPNT